METKHAILSAISGASIAAIVALTPTFVTADTLSDVAGRYRIQPSSRVGFTVSQVGGGGITGDFKKFSGVFALNSSDIKRSEIDFTLYPESVSTGEARVESFLKSDAVFDSANFPTITFKSTQITQTSSDTAQISGILTARGKSSPANFQASLADHGKNTITFHVQGKLLRSRYGMDVGTPIYSNVVQFDMTIRGQRS
ncbi:polyisoprenoid-binding protein [Phyllobacterium sp. SYP-B3895]|uniref:Polyisoprenoid-binding protein n=1 Tax=Phyllobacterium pellucidum TaxID=2740464 RepID=A0A849VVJ3_9HYPH|nr:MULTISPECIES: YceI family protein [Phyllobacterium]MRG57392.1 polyisoprenoid-binding protein [Phyllobacterium sp. SYP-B3895]NTS34008.1 polyisoprenoid-binding protein [Phyllobacterium pellucidum]UGY08743.1 YceI family protein [Phyllobacterium sp. T1018]SFI92331.1 Polyisoprenoid-binding protein YceI [Phyllobacterium sp. CL33Tsu]